MAYVFMINCYTYLCLLLLIIIYLWPGIPHFYNLQEVSINASRICRATHYDPRCVAASVMVACIVALMLQVSHSADITESREGPGCI